MQFWNRIQESKPAEFEVQNNKNVLCPDRGWGVYTLLAANDQHFSCN